MFLCLPEVQRTGTVFGEGDTNRRIASRENQATTLNTNTTSPLLGINPEIERSPAPALAPARAIAQESEPPWSAPNFNSC